MNFEARSFNSEGNITWEAFVLASDTLITRRGGRSHVEILVRARAKERAEEGMAEMVDLFTKGRDTLFRSSATRVWDETDFETSIHWWKASIRFSYKNEPGEHRILTGTHMTYPDASGIGLPKED